MRIRWWTRGMMGKDKALFYMKKALNRMVQGFFMFIRSDSFFIPLIYP